MPRPKKDGRYLNLYLDRALYEEFLRDEENTEREISFMGSLFLLFKFSHIGYEIIKTIGGNKNESIISMVRWNWDEPPFL